MALQKICHQLAVWRANPNELIRRATYADEPERFGEQKHRMHEAVLFFTRLGLRPLTIRCLAVAYRNTGYSPVGFGYFTSALKDQQDVIKIYEFSVHCTPEEQQALIASLQKRLHLAEQYLGTHLTPTSVSIEPHPLTNKSSVVLRQKHIAGRPLKRRPYAHSLSPTQKKQFLDLLQAARKLYNETGYLLDVNGHNLISQKDKVVIVDTILMGEVDAKMRPSTLRILERELAILTNQQ